MTTTQSREPARTNPRDAQSAGSRHTTPDLGALLTLILAWLMFAGAVGIVAALLAATGRDPSWCLGVLALAWTAIHTSALPAQRRGDR